MNCLRHVVAFGLGLALMAARSAAAQSVIDFEDLPETGACALSASFTHHRVLFDVSSSGCLGIYRCFECTDNPQPNLTLSLNTTDVTPAVLTVVFQTAVPS